MERRPILAGFPAHFYGSFLSAPRTFSANNPAWSAINAHACTCHAQTTHSRLLAMNHQNPCARRDGWRDATSQAAMSVTAMAGHWMASSQFAASMLLATIGAFERGDVEFAHLHHRGECALRSLVRLDEPVEHLRGHHLPGESISILEPAAHLRLRIAPGRELVPVIVELLLVIDEDLKRDCFVELEDGPAIERGERQPREFEGDGHDRTFGLLMRFLAGLSVTGNFQDPGIRENSDVEIRGFLTLAVEPQARGDLLADLHECSPFRSVHCMAEREPRNSTLPGKLRIQAVSDCRTAPDVGCRTRASSSSSRLRPRVSGTRRQMKITPASARTP